MLFNVLILFMMLFTLRRSNAFVSGFRTSAAKFTQKLRMSSDVSYNCAFMFPGQGAQTVGMAGALCEEVPAAKELFEKASTILGYDLLDKCVNGPKESLDSTAVAQPAIFVASMAALEKLKIDNPEAVDKCTVSMGLSLGEYTALCFAGVFSFEDGVKLTKARGEAMQSAADASESGMIAVIGLDKDVVSQICEKSAEKSGKPISIANYLVNGNYAISGAKEACEVSKEIAAEMGARMAVPLAVAGAFHTDFMEPAVTSLKAALDTVEFQSPRIPVVSNVDAKPHSDPVEIKDILCKQVVKPVLWETIITEMVGAESWGEAYEIGPGTVCRGIVKRFGKKLPVTNIQA